MNTSTLYPPHSQHLSDNTICAVIQRSGVLGRNQTVKEFQAHDISPRQLAATQYVARATTPARDPSIPSNMTSERSPAEAATGKRARHDIESSQEIYSRYGSTAQAEDKRHRTSVNALRAKIPPHKLTSELLEALIQSDVLLRERRRITQQKYRKKIDDRAVRLEGELRELEKEVRQHELHHQRLISHVPTETTPWNVVAEYYHLFRYGSKVPDATALSSESKQRTSPKEAQDQMAFLVKAMASDVSVNSGFGLDVLLQEWQLVPQVHKNIMVRLVRLEYDEEAAMLATVKVYSTITKAMLSNEFSHLIEYGQLSSLAKKLLGKRLAMSISVRYGWDATTGRVTGMHFTVDLVPPFLKMLGNLKDVSRVLENSCLAAAVGASR